MKQSLFIIAAGITLPSLAWATDARMSYTTAASTYETIAGMSSYALAKNGTLTTPTITKPSIDGGALTTDGNNG